MRAVIQRVDRAAVIVDGIVVAKIEKGFLTLLGVGKGDSEQSACQLIRKITELRIFEDSAGKMNLSLRDVGGSNLLVSQFTLAADCGSGRRPSFISAEAPDRARHVFEAAVEESRKLSIRTATGVFQADMKIELVNSGPATFVLDA